MERHDLLLAREKLRLILLATEKAPEILALCRSLPLDGASLNAEVGKLLGISEEDAGVVLELRLSMFTPRTVMRAEAELAAIQDRLDALDPR